MESEYTGTKVKKVPGHIQVLCKLKHTGLLFSYLRYIVLNGRLLLPKSLISKQPPSKISTVTIHVELHVYNPTPRSPGQSILPAPVDDKPVRVASKTGESTTVSQSPFSHRKLIDLTNSQSKPPKWILI